MRERFRHALASQLGRVITPELAAWLETQCFAYEVGFVATTGILAGGDMREKLDTLVKEMMGMPQAHCPVREFFSPGVYAREITIPKGTVLVGAVHKTQNLAVLSMGRLRLVTESGTTEIEASPTPMTVQPGGMNAALALEDSVWTNYFANPTNERDPRKLVEMLSESSYDELLGGCKNQQLLAHAERQRLEV